MSAGESAVGRYAREIDDRLLLLGRVEIREAGTTTNADAATRALVALVTEARRLEATVATLQARLDATTP